MNKLLTTSLIASSILVYDLYASDQSSNEEEPPLKIIIRVENEPPINGLMKLSASKNKTKRQKKKPGSKYSETRITRFAHGDMAAVPQRSNKNKDLYPNAVKED
jgi:hypothetical protein